MMVVACDAAGQQAAMTVGRAAASREISAGWNAGPWKDTPSAAITNAMGGKSGDAPSVEVKVLCDSQAVYVAFRCLDRHIRSVTTNYQGPVYQDSCVEFFFSPEHGVSNGYFNLEINAGGTALFTHRKARNVRVREISAADFAEATVVRSMPAVVDPETAGEWVIGIRLPFGLIRKYAPVFVPPAPGAVWRANFYKCGDGTSVPHWLTWSPVDSPHPDFHRPDCFGTLVFK